MSASSVVSSQYRYLLPPVWCHHMYKIPANTIVGEAYTSWLHTKWGGRCLPPVWCHHSTEPANTIVGEASYTSCCIQSGEDGVCLQCGVITVQIPANTIVGEASYTSWLHTKWEDGVCLQCGGITVQIPANTIVGGHHILLGCIQSGRTVSASSVWSSQYRYLQTQ